MSMACVFPYWSSVQLSIGDLLMIDEEGADDLEQKAKRVVDDARAYPERSGPIRLVLLHLVSSEANNDSFVNDIASSHTRCLSSQTRQ